MKKLISFSLVALLYANAFAQDVNSKEEQQLKKSSDTKIKETAKVNSLDGRSFKITFTERQADVKPAPQTGMSGTTDAKTSEKPVSEYSLFDANSKVMLSFSDGKILSPILLGEGCTYRINTSGNEMVAFSSYCSLNTGNRKVEEATAQDTKMKIEAANAQQPVSSGNPSPDVMTAPATVPPDETKQHLPPGVSRSENADLNTPPANTSPVLKSENIQRQTESPVKPQPATMATISGVVNGNAIHGTLSWKEADGRQMSYAFSGSAATKKDMNDSRVVGMK